MKSTKLIWKTPKTAKAKEICDAIYIASIKVFSENYETANTNKIAQIAGVNISSLYRYFENKEAVLAYTIMRYILESRDLNLEVISQDKLIYSNEPKEFISQLFQVSIDRYRKDILFLKVMYIEGGRLGLTEEIFRIREGIAEDLARHMIDKYNLNLDIQVAQKKILNLLNNFMGLIQGYAIFNQAVFDPNELAPLIENVVSGLKLD